MFHVQLDSRLVNSLLKRIPNQELEYRHGCFLGGAKLPLGAVRAVAVPSFNGSELVLAIPFKEIKGDITGKFFLSKILSAFWGTISKHVEKAIVPLLQKHGLGRDLLTIEKSKEAGGEVGKIKISVKALNRWLSGLHPRLTPEISAIKFETDGILVEGNLSLVESFTR